MNNPKTKKILTYLFLFLIICFNIYLYRNEIKIKIDPNDNSFQYALVDEAYQIWKKVFSGKLSPFCLLDSHNERWNEGFALSTYYAHLPQAVIALFGFLPGVDLHQFFNWLKFLFLILLPISFFWGGRILGLSLLESLLAALFSQLTFTDGLYGIDSSSYLWRGWGLSSQLLAVFFLPLAFAYSYTYLTRKRNLGKAIIFNFITASCHSGIFLMLAVSYPILIFFQLENWQEILKRLAIFGLLTGFSLAYYFIPFFSQGDFRNFSYWDPLWKFNSLEINQILIWLFNGAIFDFNRWPVLSLLVVFGLLWGLGEIGRVKKSADQSSWLPAYLSVLFIVYLLLFFGRATWGKLINLIPGMAEFHLHRYIVMVQFTGVFLAAGFFGEIAKKLRKKFSIPYFSLNWEPSLDVLSGESQSVQNWYLRIFYISGLIITVLFTSFLSVYLLEKPIIKYARENNEMIISYNQLYEKEAPHYLALKKKLASLPAGRVYAGRPGNWGRQMTIGGVALYMVLAQDGLATIGFAPESWSPNSEYDQFFDEQNFDFYDLYNVRYAVVPTDFKEPKFFQLIATVGPYRLFQINTSGWFTLGKTLQTVSAKKTDFVNIIHLWETSDLVKNHVCPQIFIGEMEGVGSEIIEMVDNYNYQDRSGNLKTIWEKFPLISSKPLADTELVLNNEKKTANGYQTSFQLTKDCLNCVVVLKQTYHPNWQVTVNGEKTKAFPVFPFFVGIPINREGEYTVAAIYKPSGFKIFLFLLASGVFGWLLTNKKIRNRISGQFVKST